MAEEESPKAVPAIASPIATSCPSYTSILEEHNNPNRQRVERLRLIQKMEEMEGGKCAIIAHITNQALLGSSLDSSDIPVLGNILRSVGDVDVLNLILHSPGGDGTCVEKVVSLCRSQCKTFRVIIPNKAKSAATMIAMGADEIIMGPPSEIGPIDAQVPAVIEGFQRYLSAQSFIDARESLLLQFEQARKAKKDVRPYLQMLASLDIPHIEECKRMMDFGRDVVRSLLSKHMFSNAQDKAKKVDTVVDSLSSVATHKVHGRLIDGPTARNVLGLKVKLLPKDDPLWQLIWEYYTRSEIHLGNMSGTKLFETRHEALTASANQKR